MFLMNLNEMVLRRGGEEAGPGPRDGGPPKEGGAPPGMAGTLVGGSSAGMSIHKSEGLVPINENVNQTFRVYTLPVMHWVPIWLGQSIPR